MNTENHNHAPGAPSVTAGVEETRFSFDTMKRWMTEELQLRIARGWLVAAATTAVILAFIAID